jgi:HEAT repeat protein
MKVKAGAKAERLSSFVSELSAKSPDKRTEAAAQIGSILARAGDSPQALIRALQDRSELVRVQAAESLGLIGDRTALRALWMALRDRSGLVRSYVASAIGDLGKKKDAGRLRRALARERSSRAKVGYYAALHKLGEREAIPRLIELLRSADYRVRCAAANNLGRLVSRGREAETVSRALRAAMREEPTVAARSSFRSSLRLVRGHLARGQRSRT